MMVAVSLPLALPVHAQNSTTPASRSVSVGRLVTPPYSPYPVLVLPVPPRDDRTPRQRCRDDQADRIAHPLTDLDSRAIDLACSQR